MLRRFLIATAIVVTFFPRLTLAQTASSDEVRTHEASRDTSGLRAEVGAFALVHAQRSHTIGAAQTRAAPGLEIGGAYRTAGSWDLYANVRVAYLESCKLDIDYEVCAVTEYGALSAGGRWYASKSAPVSFFFDLGARALAFQFDEYSGAGPAAHLGIGAEIFHDDRHHRLSLQAGVDIPTFGATQTVNSTTFGYYAVPVTAMARWTF